MQAYLDLLKKTFDKGIDEPNARTGKMCRVLVGEQIKFDLRDGFPAVTTKKLAFRSVVGELLGFFRGYTNAADFRALNCKIWDQNANETPAWLANPNRKGVDDLGRIYGAQWTDWKDKRIVTGPAARDTLRAKGYAQRLYDASTGEYLMERGINQLEGALTTLLTDPSDRRIIISGWRLDEFDNMALPPCHVDKRFVALESDKTLHMVMTIRSWDLYLGGPFNIASEAVFLAVMARMIGYTPATLTIHATNAHLYADHFSQLQAQLQREPKALPALALGPSIPESIALADVPGAFARIQPEDVQLEGYEHWPALPAPMAV